MSRLSSRMGNKRLITDLPKRMRSVAVPYRCRIYSCMPYGREEGGTPDIDAVTRVEVSDV